MILIDFSKLLQPDWDTLCYEPGYKDGCLSIVEVLNTLFGFNNAVSSAESIWTLCVTPQPKFDAKRLLLKNLPPIDGPIQIWQWRNLAQRANEPAQIMRPTRRVESDSRKPAARIAAAAVGTEERERDDMKVLERPSN